MPVLHQESEGLFYRSVGCADLPLFLRFSDWILEPFWRYDIFVFHFVPLLQQAGMCKTWFFFGNACTKSWPFAVSPVFRLLADFVCLLIYDFCLSLWKIARCSVTLLLPLFNQQNIHHFSYRFQTPRYSWNTQSINQSIHIQHLISTMSSTSYVYCNGHKSHLILFLICKTKHTYLKVSRRKWESTSNIFDMQNAVLSYQPYIQFPCTYCNVTVTSALTKVWRRRRSALREHLSSPPV